MRRRNKRYWWLIKLISKNKFTVGAEIGCANGATTGRLLRMCSNLRLYAVDKWEKVEGGPEAGAMGETIGENCTAWDPVRGFQRFSSVTSPYRSRLTVLRGIVWRWPSR